MRVTLLASIGLGISVLFLSSATAYAGRGDLPASLVCATVSECTKQIDTIKDPARLAQALADRCRAMFRANPMQETAEDCDKAIVLDPGQISAYEIRAQIKKFASVSAHDPVKKQQLVNEAKADFDKLVEIGRDQTRSHLLRGEFFLFTGQNALALPDFDKVAALDPKEPLVYLLRSRAYHGLGNDDLALNDGAAFLNIAPPRADILTMMADIHLSRKDLKQALDLADEALVASGKNDGLNWERNKALTLRGRIYLETGDKEKAKQDYMAALSSWPSDKVARAGLELLLQKPVHTEEDCTRAAMVKGQQGDLNAIEICSEVLDIFESGIALEQRAALYFSTGQYNLAAADYSKLIEADPKYLGYYGHRALVYRAAGQPNLALADLNRLLTDHSHSKVSDRMNLLLRAEIEITLRKDDDALRDISDLLTTDARNPRALTLRAWVQARRDQFTEAKADIDAALAINAKLYEKQIAKVQDALARRSREEAETAFADVFREN